MNSARALTVTACLVALGLGACAPTYGPDDTVSLTPISAESRAARDAALRGDPVSSSSAAPAVAAGTARTVAVQPLNVSPGQLGNDTTYTGGPAAQVSATPSAASYAVVEAKPLPTRPSSSKSGTGVVAFALQTDHPVGQSVYPRSATPSDRTSRACARYASADLAQAAFLQSGGPESDGQGLDPDGDGYACAWNPDRFRSAVR